MNCWPSPRGPLCSGGRQLRGTNIVRYRRASCHVHPWLTKCVPLWSSWFFFSLLCSFLVEEIFDMQSTLYFEMTMSSIWRHGQGHVRAEKPRPSDEMQVTWSSRTILAANRNAEKCVTPWQGWAISCVRELSDSAQALGSRSLAALVMDTFRCVGVVWAWGV
jgi:hypothetical protein